MIFPDHCAAVDAAEKKAKSSGALADWALYTQAASIVKGKVEAALDNLADRTGPRQADAVAVCAYFNAWLWRRGGTL